MKLSETLIFAAILSIIAATVALSYASFTKSVFKSHNKDCNTITILKADSEIRSIIKNTKCAQFENPKYVIQKTVAALLALQEKPYKITSVQVINGKNNTCYALKVQWKISSKNLKNKEYETIQSFSFRNILQKKGSVL